MESLEKVGPERLSPGDRMSVVEYEMDHQTAQLLKAFQESVHHQLQPLADRQQEILIELKQQRETNHRLAIQVALHEDRIGDNKRDINSGLATVRKEMDEKFADRARFWAPALAAVAGIVSILVALVMRFVFGS